MLLFKYIFGQTAVYYVQTEVEGHEGKTTVGWAAYPAQVQVDADKLRCDSLVQVAFSGDENLIDYTLGLTMRNRNSTLLSMQGQRVEENRVISFLTDGKGNEYEHHLTYFPETEVFETFLVYHNRTSDTRTLEMLESISLSGISSPCRVQPSTCGLTLHRMTAAWSRECRLKSDPFSHLGLDMSWARYGVKVEKWGQRGSMPVRDYFPFAAIEDEGGTIWGMVMEAPYSWQMEVYQEKETCSLSGGLADYEFGHWKKNIPSGGSFTTDKAFFTVGDRGVLGVCNRLLHEADRRLSLPRSEETMPVLFNEYCTTWGCPSEENIEKILQAIESLPVDYFVIDCGWYKPDDKGWCNAIGDWKESRLLFPNGIVRVAEKIHAAGKKAGIWFEFEVAGRDGEFFHEREEDLIHRDGFTVTSKNRRFLDLRRESVKTYLDEKLIKFLKQNSFDYIKIDYNDTIGMGCDGAESLGEGGRRIAEESLGWMTRLKEEIPGLIIENCSSGGGRIEPKRMGMVSMCSFSDAHECPEIPLVAANVSRVVPARQSQIWVVLRDEEELSHVVYSLCSGMMGRICLSGDVLNLTREKITIIRKGLEFYEKIKDIVAKGDIIQIDCNVEYYREPFGRQIYCKQYGDRLLVLIHRLDDTSEIRQNLKGYRLKEYFTDREFTFDGETLVFSGGKKFVAGAFLFEKSDMVGKTGEQTGRSDE